ncbi:MAG: PAS domain-containing protein [Anaerolineales bacterium]|nr:PAS domain-containing protein [Anaerolineales bacterium]
MILITDWEVRCEESNRQAVLLSGYSKEELRALSIDQLHEVKWNRALELCKTLRRYDECTYESGLLKRDGSSIPIEVHARRVEFEETDSISGSFRMSPNARVGCPAG